MKKLILCLLTLSLAFSYSFAQDIKLSDANKKSIEYDGVIRCYTTEIDEQLKAEFPNKTSREEFEAWIGPKVKKYKEEKQNNLNKSQAIRTIPIVFHILTDGSGVDNVSQTLINEQINQINLDFANQSGSTVAVSVDTEIQFCAAKKSPIGQNLAEEGINRITTYGEGPFTTSEIENTIKSPTQWDPTQYLNIWVTQIDSGSTAGTLLGYAYYPDAPSLPGLGTPVTPPLDGIVITTTSVGSIVNPNPAGGSNIGSGRTLTHEIGHYLGLIHIWGDGGCGTIDYCDDTPDSDAPNNGCSAAVSCGSSDMIENHMDYTSGSCRNTFTADQSARMNTVLDSSPRRMELVTTSDVCTLAPVYNLDASLELVSVNNPECTTTIDPELRLTNLGTTTLTQATIEYNIDFTGVQTINWTGNLLTNESVLVTIPQQNLAGGFHSISTAVQNPNNGLDEETSNDDEFLLFNIDSFDIETINFTLKPDNFGSQITWEFRDPNNTVINSGGPYTDSDTTEITEVFTINTSGCYTFAIFDSNDNGICCGVGEGFYRLETPSGVIIKNGANYVDSEATKFILNTSLSTPDFFINNGIKLYPNPATNLINISVEDSNSLPDNYIIYNVLGQKLASNNINNSKDLIINTENFSSGVHFIKIFKNDAAQVFRFIKR